MNSNKPNLQTKLFRFLLSPSLQRVALKIWTGEQEDPPGTYVSEIFLLLENSWNRYELSVADLERQANLSNWLVMNFAHLTLSAYQVMLEDGLNQDEAVERIQKLTWEITSTWTTRAKRVSRYLFRDQIKELLFFTRLVMRTFFSPPGYKFDIGETDGGFFLDVRRCPVAELMISEGASELCIQSWCGVDFDLVEIIGGKLQRNGTLAMGEKKCDFVFHPNQRVITQSSSG